MRYYKITVDGAPGNIFPPVSGAGGATWTSHPWGLNSRADPGAQEIEFHLEELVKGGQPTSDSSLVVKGVSWEQIGEAANLIDKLVTIEGGMAQGLPLAAFQSRPNLPGLLIRGNISRCWGNWEGTEMSIGMIIQVAGSPPSSNGTSSSSSSSSSNSSSSSSASPQTQVTHQLAQRVRLNHTGPRSIARMLPASFRPRISLTDTGSAPGTSDGINLQSFPVGIDAVIESISNLFSGGYPGLSAPLNLIHNLLPGMQLSDAIRQTLGTAFPGVPLNIAISPLLKLNYQDAGVYQNLDQYAQYLYNFSRSILGTSNYFGVNISSHGTSINVWDKTLPITQVAPGGIAVGDLIGQPTWVDRNQIHIKTILRSDIHVASTISLPPNLLINVGQQANAPGESPQRTHLGFAGTFNVDRVIHSGAFRSPSGDDWSTNYYATVQDDQSPVTQNSQSAQTTNQNQNPPAMQTTPPSSPADTILPSPQSSRLLRRQVRYY